MSRLQTKERVPGLLTSYLYRTNLPGIMNKTSTNISVATLKHALAIREQIDVLESQMSEILGGGEIPSPFTSTPKKRRGMSAAARRKIGVAQKLRWAKVKGADADKPDKKTRRKMNPATKAKIAAAARVRWARVKAGINSL
jgi:hypothetical protein